MYILNHTFLDLIGDPELQEDLREWLHPTDKLIKKINDFTKGTILEDCYRTATEEENTLVLKYYLTDHLSKEDEEELTLREDILYEVELPLTVKIEVYEPLALPSLTLGGKLE